jgi:anti-sigma factor RsiW
MISCRHFAERLVDYVEAELPIEVRLEMDEHVGYCSSCATYLQSYQLTIRVSQKLAEKPLPAELAQRLRTALAPHCGGHECAPPP